MVVKVVQQTLEEKEEALREVREGRGALAEDILSSLDLPETIKGKEAKSKVGAGEEATPEESVPTGGEDMELGDSVSFVGEDDNAVKGDIIEIDEEHGKVTVKDAEGQEHVVSSQDLSPVKRVKKEGEEENVEDGDLIPKSKVDKIIKKLTKRVDSLSRELKITRSAAPKATDTRDPDLVKLEAKSTEELNTLKRNVRLAQAKLAKGEETGESNAELEKLVDLEMKIDRTISSSGQRFVNLQMKLYHERSQEVYDDPEIEDVDAAAPIIKKIAIQIFEDYPRLREIPDGQALALGFAVDHYKATQKTSSGKSKEKELKRETNKLKKKIALNPGRHKGVAGSNRLKALRASAFQSRGSNLAKENFILHDPQFAIDDLIPDDYKG